MEIIFHYFHYSFPATEILYTGVSTQGAPLISGYHFFFLPLPTTASATWSTPVAVWPAREIIRFGVHILYSLPVEPWVNHWLSLSLNFLLYKVGATYIPCNVVKIK